VIGIVVVPGEKFWHLSFTQIFITQAVVFFTVRVHCAEAFFGARIPASSKSIAIRKRWRGMSFGVMIMAPMMNENGRSSSSLISLGYGVCRPQCSQGGRNPFCKAITQHTMQGVRIGVIVIS
jgi:hypothetical protein